jgi:N-formylglutamate amidohydrolase
MKKSKQTLKDIVKNKEPQVKTHANRFFLFNLMNKIGRVIEEDMYANFIALLKSYKVLGRILTGKLGSLYQDRNNLYFKNFFIDRKLYKLVKADLEYFYPRYKDVRLTITKRGVMIYDNYQKNVFNVLLLTIHSGTWVPTEIEKKINISEKERFQEEDVDTNKLYSSLVLEKNGIWIDNKQSRFVVDFNRNFDQAIYQNKFEDGADILWKESLTKKEIEGIHRSYKEFYFTLAKLVDSYKFNIIFDGHSMRDEQGRPNISFGTKYIPRFYMPIVKSMQRKMMSLEYSPIALDNPYQGGNILSWLSLKFPNLFIIAMEINKKVYMTKNRTKSIKYKINKISEDLEEIFNIEIEDN